MRVELMPNDIPLLHSRQFAGLESMRTPRTSVYIVVYGCIIGMNIVEA